jgi:hypothetical protein
MSEVSICNSALIKLGASRIASLAEQSKEAKLCDEQYDKLRDEVLTDHPWNFSIKRVALAKLPTVPVFGFANEFQLPNDCLRVLELNTGTDYDYQIEGDKLLIDIEAVSIKYISRVEDTTKFSTLFSSALAYRIAAELAYPLVQSNSVAEKAKQDYLVALRNAKTVDAQEGTPPRTYNDTWVNSRL